MASEGSIVARVTLAGDTIPVKDAVVTATTDNGTTKELLGVRRTDENGKTTPIIVSTPDIELSLAPEDTQKPYASVDIRVDHPAAYTVIIKNVQVFADNRSIINVSLIPLADGADESEEEVIEITGQNL